MWWQRGSGGGGSDSVVEAASLAAEAVAWRKGNVSNSGSALGSKGAVRRWWQQCGAGGGSVAYADNDCNGNDDKDD